MSEARAEPGLLWGRTAFWAVVVVLAFLVGRWTAGLGADGEPLDRLRAEVTKLSAENEEYRRRSEMVAAGSAPADAESAPAARPSPSPPARDDEPRDPEAGRTPSSGNGETYTVVPGDTLSEIAARFYDDSSRVSALQRANGIAPGEELPVGLELEIPRGG